MSYTHSPPPLFQYKFRLISIHDGRQFSRHSSSVDITLRWLIIDISASLISPPRYFAFIIKDMIMIPLMTFSPFTYLFSASLTFSFHAFQYFHAQFISRTLFVTHASFDYFQNFSRSPFIAGFCRLSYFMPPPGCGMYNAPANLASSEPIDAQRAIFIFACYWFRWFIGDVFIEGGWFLLSFIFSRDMAFLFITYYIYMVTWH